MHHKIFIFMILAMLNSFSILANINVPDNCKIAFDEIEANYFKKKLMHQIEDVEILSGGHSNSCLLIKAGEKKYVLRVTSGEASKNDLKRELFAMQEADTLKISPEIYYITKDLKAVLMKYIEAETLSIDQSKNPKNMQLIAQALRTAHATSKNPYLEIRSLDLSLLVYSALRNKKEIKKELDEAAALIKKYDKELEKFNAPLVSVHGDLSARNILIHEDRAIFIDWEHASFEDPFFDLSHLAFCMDFDFQQEMEFLESYLQRTPTKSEIQRYYIIKKINFAQMAIVFFYFSLNQPKHIPAWNKSLPLKDWSYYVKVYHDKKENDEVLTQYYYDLAKWCLHFAKL